MPHQPTWQSHSQSLSIVCTVLMVRHQTTKLTITHLMANFPSIPDNNHPACVAGSILVPELEYSILVSCNLGDLVLKLHIQFQSFCEVMEVAYLKGRVDMTPVHLLSFYYLSFAYFKDKSEGLWTDYVQLCLVIKSQKATSCIGLSLSAFVSSATV